MDAFSVSTRFFKRFSCLFFARRVTRAARAKRTKAGALVSPAVPLINTPSHSTPTVSSEQPKTHHHHDTDPTPKASGLVGGVGGHVALTSARVAEEARSEGAHVPKGSLAARMQSAKDRYDNTQQARAQEAEAGPMGRGVVGGKAVAARPEDAEPDVCPVPTREEKKDKEKDEGA